MNKKYVKKMVSISDQKHLHPVVDNNNLNGIPQHVIGGQNSNFENHNSLPVPEAHFSQQQFASQTDQQHRTGDRSQDFAINNPNQNIYDTTNGMIGSHSAMQRDNSSLSPSNNSHKAGFTPIQSFSLSHQYRSSNDMQSPPLQQEAGANHLYAPTQIDFGLHILSQIRAHSPTTDEQQPAGTSFHPNQKIIQNHSQIIRDNKRHLRNGVGQQLNLQRELNQTQNVRAENKLMEGQVEGGGPVAE